MYDSNKICTDINQHIIPKVNQFIKDQLTTVNKMLQSQLPSVNGVILTPLGFSLSGPWSLCLNPIDSPRVDQANSKLQEVIREFIKTAALENKILDSRKEDVYGSILRYPTFIYLMQLLLRDYRHIYYLLALEFNPLLQLSSFSQDKKRLLKLFILKEQDFIKQFKNFLFNHVYPVMEQFYAQLTLSLSEKSMQDQAGIFFRNYLEKQEHSRYTAIQALENFTYYAAIFDQIELLWDDRTKDKPTILRVNSTKLDKKAFLKSLALFIFEQGVETLIDPSFLAYSIAPQEKSPSKRFNECYRKLLGRFSGFLPCPEPLVGGASPQTASLPQSSILPVMRGSTVLEETEYPLSCWKCRHINLWINGPTTLNDNGSRSMGVCVCCQQSFYVDTMKVAIGSTCNHMACKSCYGQRVGVTSGAQSERVHAASPLSSHLAPSAPAPQPPQSPAQEPRSRNWGCTIS